MAVSSSLRAELIELLPNMRAFAMSLAGQSDIADDIVQEALMKAWANFDSFKEGTNLKAWLFVILRNEFYTHYRKHRREIQDTNSRVEQLVSHAEQDAHLNMSDFKKALLQVSEDQREALILVGASGFSYEEAAEICGVAVGTIKSRVNRARRHLSKLLSIESAVEFGPDDKSRAILKTEQDGFDATCSPWR